MATTAKDLTPWRVNRFVAEKNATATDITAVIAANSENIVNRSIHSPAIKIRWLSTMKSTEGTPPPVSRFSRLQWNSL
jgi:hypothetical protein